jgi:preprotein translocase subunit SecA
VLKEIKSTYAERALLQLVDKVEIEPNRTLFARALCEQLSVESIPVVEKIVEGEYASWYLDLEEEIYCNCVINRIEHPKLSQWKKSHADMELPADSPFFHHVNKHIEPVRNEPKVGRNDPCPCGSGKKYKKCCDK